MGIQIGLSIPMTSTQTPRWNAIPSSSVTRFMRQPPACELLLWTPKTVDCDGNSDRNFNTHDEYPNSEMECNPIIVGDTLYATTPRLRVIALDAENGRLRWEF